MMKPRVCIDGMLGMGLGCTNVPTGVEKEDWNAGATVGGNMIYVLSGKMKFS